MMDKRSGAMKAKTNNGNNFNLLVIRLGTCIMGNYNTGNNEEAKGICKLSSQNYVVLAK